MPILLNKISTKGGRGGQKSPKSCLRRIRTAPYSANIKGNLTRHITKMHNQGYKDSWKVDEVTDIPKLPRNKKDETQF